MLGTVGRAGDLLSLFDTERPEWGATAVSRALSITKSQAHEMLVSLEAIGLLRRASGGRFRLGWRTLSLSQRLMRSEFSPEALRLIPLLGRHTGARVELIALDGEEYVRIAGHGAAIQARGLVQEAGETTAIGLVLLSDMTEAKLRKLTPFHETIAAEVAAVQERGLAARLGPDEAEVAAPVLGWDGSVLAALGLSVPPEVWNTRGLILTKAVTGTAKRLSESVRDHSVASMASTSPPVVTETSPAQGQSLQPQPVVCP